MDLIIRNIKEEDLCQVVDTQVEAWQISYKGIIDEKYLSNMDKKERLEKRKNDYMQNRFIVAESNSQIVGFCRFIENNSFSSNINEIDCEIMALYVKPELKRKGIGRALFSYAKNDFIKQGKKRMIIWCLKENYPSRSFYEKMGGELKFEKDFILEGKTYKEVGFVYNL